jgi:maleate cis-trans isomerase
VPRFGCILPSVAHLPWDMTELLSPELGATIATLNVRNGLPGEHERALAEMQRAVDVLIDEGCTAIVAFGVPVSARQGYAAESAVLAALTAGRGSVPIVSSLTAAALKLRAAGARRPLLVTQYRPDINTLIQAFLRDAADLESAGAFGLGAGNAAEVNALRPDDFATLAGRAVAETSDADGVFLSARGNLRDVANRIEAETGLPAVEQVSAAIWWAQSQLLTTKGSR